MQTLGMLNTITIIGVMFLTIILAGVGTLFVLSLGSVQIEKDSHDDK